MAERKLLLERLDRLADALDDEALTKCADLVRDAIDLLKEQKAVPVKKREVLNMMYVWCCGSCGTAITDGDKYCRMCGKKMKWNDKTDL